MNPAGMAVTAWDEVNVSRDWGHAPYVVPQRFERFFERSDAVIVSRCFDGPEYAGLPPVLGIGSGPRDAIVADIGRTGDLVIAFVQVGKGVTWYHQQCDPCADPIQSRLRPFRQPFRRPLLELDSHR